MHEMKKKSIIVWKKNLEFLCRFYWSKILFNSNVHADSQFYVSLYKYVSIFWINNDFAWFFAFFQSADYVCSHEQKKCINISTSFFCLLGRSNAKILFFASYEKWNSNMKYHCTLMHTMEVTAASILQLKSVITAKRSTI